MVRLFLILLLLAILSTISGFRILGIFPSMSKSHYIIGNALMKGLADAGHDVTVISPYSLNRPHLNYRDITIHGIEELCKENILPWLEWSKADHYTMFTQMNKIGYFISNHTLNHEALQNLLQSPKERFDVIILEIFLNEALLGLGHHFQTPIIGFSTFCSSKWSNDMVGTPAAPSYVPSPFLPFTNKMTFLERCANTIFSLVGSLVFDYLYMPIQEEIYNSVFPDPKPKLWQLRQNVSLVLLNTHFTLNYANPYVSNMIEVGGMQLIRRSNNVIPEKMKLFLDAATDGAIYFSMGTNIKSTDLSPEVISGLVRLFSKMKQRILWKWDDNQITNLSENIFISQWFPQDAVLQHPNVKIFITHGGLLGLTEAIYHAVPIIGIPVFGDQSLNIAKAVKDGYGISIPLAEFNEKSLSVVLNAILIDQSYQENVIVLSKKFRDQPQDPLSKAIFWTEYIARHKGAPFLRSAGQDLNFFQYHSLDVFGCLFSIVGLIFYIIYISLKYLMKSIIKAYYTKLKTN